MWIPFRLDGRNLEWQVVADGSDRCLQIRSTDGAFEVHSRVNDNLYYKPNGKLEASAVYPPQLIGREFPPGCPIAEGTYPFSGTGFEIAKYGMIHTDFVRSLIGRWTYRRRYHER